MKNGISSKEVLEKVLKEEKELYIGNHVNILMLSIFQTKRFQIWRCLEAFRKMQYYRRQKSFSENSYVRRLVSKLLFYFYNYRYCKYSSISTVEIDVNSNIGIKCDIWHGNVVINGDLGDNCILHGQNTIGNKGNGREGEKPIIGNNVDIGVAAIIIGNVSIADGCKIGANATVVKSIISKNAIVIGTPAH